LSSLLFRFMKEIKKGLKGLIKCNLN